MRAVVFAGPSIEPKAVAGYPVTMLPPVARGDIDRLMSRDSPPRYIGIVDGQFLQGLMLSPKEVLRAIDTHGARVFGSSSLGALRAVELADYGMTGVGKIFELYRSGQIDADDEVAITFDPDSLRPLCEPMVNIRIAVAAAVDGGVISPETADRALAVAKSLYFPDRTYSRLIQELGARTPHDEVRRLRAFLGTRAPDAKRQDAIALLTAIQQAMEQDTTQEGTAAARLG